MSFIAACVQSTATPDVHADIRVLTGFIREAAAKGARFIATPEYFDALHIEPKLARQTHRLTVARLKNSSKD